MISVGGSLLSRDQWNRTAASFADFSFLQMWEYGEAKKAEGSWDVRRLEFKEDGKVLGLCQCMIRRIPFMGSGLVWINRGPLWRQAGEQAVSRLEEILRVLRRYWVDENRMYLRIAPPVSGDQVKVGALCQCGFVPVRRPGEWASARLDLQPPLEELRARLEKSWRNCLSKAERSGLACVEGTGNHILTYVLGEYDEMIRKKGLVGTSSPDFLARLQAMLGEGSKLSGFIAERGSERLGGVIIARYGDTSEYLVGAVSDRGKALNAGNYLLWRAVSAMKAAGCRKFDLGGMHPEKTPQGIFHFKKGLGGQPYSLIGRIDAFNAGPVSRLIRWRLDRREDAKGD